ncbi:hypothetical protein H7F51_04845 [Novosphingobium flavum]|uniref:Uncharacterized protein n=1 Tax=Novosphingobium flavum TaxID=1778672 RepID=A0A7X1FQ01_9SPHN|nr:hypothetical protein [Novosphingobium flavum]MBC2664840.1 hypothetical protein [Novosphingobium flavum]
MADEVVSTPHETTIIREKSGGGAGWAIAVILVLALIAGIWFFSRSNDSQIAKDNAITAAANNVGDAAKDVGNAAQSAGEAAQDAANNASKN